MSAPGPNALDTAGVAGEYDGAAPVPPTPPPPPPGPPAGVPGDLWTALTSYKANYAAYVVSKQASHKTAYERALAIANQAIANLESATENNDSTIQSFLASYSETSGDILDLQTKSRDIQTKGPALQDQLVQAQRLHTATAAEVDDTALYVKSAIVIGLLIVVGIVGIA